MEKVKKVECKKDPPLSIEILEHELKGLTDLQQDLYRQKTLGRSIDLKGHILNVYRDWAVFQPNGSAAEVRLQGMKNMETLKRGQPWIGSGDIVTMAVIPRPYRGLAIRLIVEVV